MSDINNTIIGQSFRDSAQSQDANGFDVELTGTPDAGQGTNAFNSDVVDGDFEPVVSAKRRPIKLILAGVFTVAVLLAGGAAYTASVMQKPKASDIDFGAIKRESPTQVAAVAVAPALGEQAAAAAPTTDTSVVAPTVLPPPAIGAVPAPIAVANPPTSALPVPGVAPAPLPVVVAVPPAGQGVPAAPTPAIAKPAVPAVGAAPALTAAAHPQPEAAKLAVAPAKPSVPPAAKPPVPPAKAAAVLPVKPVVKPAVARPTPLAAKQSVPVKPVVAAKPVPAKPQLAKAVPPQPQPIHADDSNPLGADVRPLVTVTAEQIGMRAMSADAISLATAAGIQRFKVGDYLPSGDRVIHIDPPGSTLVTDKKIIRVVN